MDGDMLDDRPSPLFSGGSRIRRLRPLAPTSAAVDFHTCRQEAAVAGRAWGRPLFVPGTILYLLQRGTSLMRPLGVDIVVQWPPRRLKRTATPRQDVRERVIGRPRLLDRGRGRPTGEFCSETSHGGQIRQVMGAARAEQRSAYGYSNSLEVVSYD